MSTSLPFDPADPAWLLMVRHTAVCDTLKGVCYGRSDVELSPDGQAHLHIRAAELAALQPTVIYHSGLGRARRLAEAVANRLGRRLRADARLAEFDFGAWELMRWDEIHAAGHDIARLIHEPATFSAPGGETVLALRDRVTSWHSTLPSRERILAIAHAGPISTLRGSLCGLPPSRWPALVPPCGAEVSIPLPGAGR